jgi:hypothetical protein
LTYNLNLKTKNVYNLINSFRILFCSITISSWLHSTINSNKFYNLYSQFDIQWSLNWINCSIVKYWM